MGTWSELQSTWMTSCNHPLTNLRHLMTTPQLFVVYVYSMASPPTCFAPGSPTGSSRQRTGEPQVRTSRAKACGTGWLTGWEARFRHGFLLGHLGLTKSRYEDE